MGLYDDITVADPRFVCSEGHDLSSEPFQSKDFGCAMGAVLIENGRLKYAQGHFGTPSPDGNTAEIYCTCRRCPAFVQFGTGNLCGCDVRFEIGITGDVVTTVTRISPATTDWLHNEPLEAFMKRCEGPMSYDEALELHVRYREMRPGHYAEFRKWASARSEALKSGADWPMTLQIGEYPSAMQLANKDN